MTKKKIIALVSSMVSLLLIAGIGLAAWVFTSGTTTSGSQNVTGGATDISSSAESVGSIVLTNSSDNYFVMFDQPTKNVGTTDYATGIYIMNGTSLSDIKDADKTTEGGAMEALPMEMTFTVPTDKVTANGVNDFEYIVKVTIPSGATEYIEFVTSGLDAIFTKAEVDTASNGTICTYTLVAAGNGNSNCGVTVGTPATTSGNYVYALQYNLSSLLKYKAAIDNVTNESTYNTFNSRVSTGTYKFEFTINSKAAA